jgi:apolipoprotein N-acyltransferase
VALVLALVGALLAGGLYALVFPPADLSGLAWVVLVAFLALLRRARRAGAGALLGAAFGAALTGLAGHWIPSSLRAGFDMGERAALVTFATLTAQVALGMAVFGALAVRLRRGVLPELLALPAAWVVGELVRTRLPGGIAWLLLGHSQAGHLFVAQAAEVAGVAGLGFAIVLVNGLWLRALSGWWGGDEARSAAASRTAAWALAIPLALAALGALRVRAVESEPAEGTLRVGLVQAEIPQAERWRERTRERNLERQLALTRDAASQGAQLVVWSETAIDFVPEDLPALRARLARALGGGADRELLVGLPRRLPESEGGTLRNSALLVDGAGRERGVYDRQQLLPVAEDDPELLLRIPGARRVLAPILRGEPYTAGSDPAPLPSAWGGIGVMICFEGVRAQGARETADRGAVLLANLSNDAYFPTRGAALQHWSQVVWRAIETRRPLVRVANGGVGAVVAASGRVLLRVEPGEARAAVAEVGLRDRPTVFLRAGFAFPFACAGLCAIGLWPRRARA